MEKLKKPTLFEKFPDLSESVGWLDLGLTAAPIHRLEKLGHDNLWIKRNDQISEIMGGNKVRRLEFILADVLHQKKEHVITLGGIGSNHCLALAIYCRQLGIRCTLCLFEQPLTCHVRENLLLYHYYGAQLIFAKGIWRSIADFYLRLKLKHPNAYFLESGGSSEIGVLGDLNAVLELEKQVKKQGLAEPGFVFCPTASNGGMAGLSLGLLLLGWKTTVIGVRTGLSRLGPIELNTTRTVAKKIKKVIRFLRQNSRMIPRINIPKPVLIDDYCGQGYGFPTSAGKHALQVFKEKEQLKLEPVYTAKTCAALLDRLDQKPFSEKPILYWHTYNSVDLSKEAATVEYRDLPPDLHWCFGDNHQVH